MAPNQRFNASEPSPRSARAAALALVSRRDYTAAELASRLKDKDHDAEAIEAAIADLRAKGFIDDQRVAAAHVRTAAAIKGRGRVRIARELAARGIARDLIDDALAQVVASDELASIRKILERKRWPPRPSRAERDHMYRHLLARGFPTDLIGKALGRRQDGDDDDEP